jgi:8-oxo-dGTP pyrophosphatase MutT (NUDIX family)
MAYSKKNKLHIVAVTALIRNDEGRYLFLKRSEREIAYPGKYALPGGKVEDNQSPAEALDEEVGEEAGLELLPERWLIENGSFVRPDDQTVKVFIYLCRAKDTSKVTISEDFTDYKWVLPSELDTIPHLGYRDELDRAEVLLQSPDLDRFAVKSFRREDSAG